jgi:hypothetical protein
MARQVSLLAALVLAAGLHLTEASCSGTTAIEIPLGTSRVVSSNTAGGHNFQGIFNYQANTGGVLGVESSTYDFNCNYFPTVNPNGDVRASNVASEIAAWARAQGTDGMNCYSNSAACNCCFGPLHFVRAVCFPQPPRTRTMNTALRVTFRLVLESPLLKVQLRPPA